MAEPIPTGASTQELLALSRQYQMTIGAGLIERAADGQLYNSYVVAMPNDAPLTTRYLTTLEIQEDLSDLTDKKE